MADLNRHQGRPSGRQPGRRPDMRGQAESLMQRSPDADSRGSLDVSPGDFLPGFISTGILPELMRGYALDRSWLIRKTPAITQTDINLFCDLVHSGDDTFLMAALAALHSQGLTTRQLLLDLLGPVARELGHRWTVDETDFSSVTIALGHLQSLRRAIAQFDEPGLLPSGPPRRALLATTPGDQHDFGIMIVDHFMHLAGWDVRTCPGARAEDIISQVSKNSFEIAGLSLSCESHLMSLERLVTTIRKVSKNGQIGILVGGSVFIERPELALLIGADATALDGHDAVRQAENIAIRHGPSSGRWME